MVSVRAALTGTAIAHSDLQLLLQQFSFPSVLSSPSSSFSQVQTEKTFTLSKRHDISREPAAAPPLCLLYSSFLMATASANPLHALPEHSSLSSWVIYPPSPPIPLALPPLSFCFCLPFSLFLCPSGCIFFPLCFS